MGETVVYGIKVGLAVSGALFFFAALLTLISLVTTWAVYDNIIGEGMRFISIYLPFRPGPIFLEFGVVSTAIIAFLVARQTYAFITSINEQS